MPWHVVQGALAASANMQRLAFNDAANCQGISGGN